VSQASKLVSIGLAAKQAGVSRQTLQYYIMLGLIEPTESTPTGRRQFNESAIQKVKLIRKLNDSGYTLRAIRELFLSGHAIKGPSHE
jgi:MerR family transcriptional regulator, copper efflux regulator